MGLGTGAASGALVVAVVGGLLLIAAPTTGPSPGSAAGSPAGAAGPQVAYGWPTGGPGSVLRPFTAPPERWAAGHRGVDLALADGDTVFAAADGVVAFAGSVAGRGVVSIDHDDGIRTTYEPVAAVVRRGALVRRGGPLGTLSGPGHCAPDPCLHWGARRGAHDYLDPLSLVATDVVIRLLPLHHGP